MIFLNRGTTAVKNIALVSKFFNAVVNGVIVRNNPSYFGLTSQSWCRQGLSLVWVLDKKLPPPADV